MDCSINHKQNVSRQIFLYIFPSHRRACRGGSIMRAYDMPVCIGVIIVNKDGKVSFEWVDGLWFRFRV